MRKFCVRSFVAGVMVSLLILPVLSGASELIEPIQASLDKRIKLRWNGEVFTPANKAGEVLYPIIYKGYAYLPIRVLGERANIKVDWDEENRVIVLEQVKEMYEGENRLKIGELGGIELEANPSTGYGWHYTIERPEIVEICTEKYISNNLDRMKTAIGEGGKTIYRIRGVKAGKTKAIYKYYRPWEGEEKAIDTRVFVIEVVK